MVFFGGTKVYSEKTRYFHVSRSQFIFSDANMILVSFNRKSDLIKSFIFSILSYSHIP